MDETRRCKTGDRYTKGENKLDWVHTNWLSKDEVG
jgi:hypothetical protein